VASTSRKFIDDDDDENKTSHILQKKIIFVCCIDVGAILKISDHGQDVILTLGEKKGRINCEKY
jgi:hypothetical protein